MHFTEEPDRVLWPQTNYLYVEKVGPFAEIAPQAWRDFHQQLPGLLQSIDVLGFLSLYRVDRSVYRAGVSVQSRPDNIPPGLQFEVFPGGAFERFTLTGSYTHLPEISGRAFAIMAKRAVKRRDDFNIEHYVNNPQTAPEDQLITEIYFPVE